MAEQRQTSRLGDTASHRVVDFHRVPSSVRLHSMSRLVLDAHGRLDRSRPLVVLLAKLGVLIWLLALNFSPGAVFRPEPCQIDTGTGQFAVNVCDIWHHIQRYRITGIWKFDLLQHFVRHGLIQRPARTSLLCGRLGHTDFTMVAMHNQLDASMTVLGVST